MIALYYAGMCGGAGGAVSAGYRPRAGQRGERPDSLGGLSYDRPQMSAARRSWLFRRPPTRGADPGSPLMVTPVTAVTANVTEAGGSS